MTRFRAFPSMQPVGVGWRSEVGAGLTSVNLQKGLTSQNLRIALQTAQRASNSSTSGSSDASSQPKVSPNSNSK